MNKNIFREYDIRGTYDIDINEDVAYTIGKAYGTYIKRYDEYMCLVGHDNRISSEALNEALIEGILSTGINVIDIGLVTTPMLYYARMLKHINPGIMVTASHNPKDDNGFKMSFNKVSNAKGKEIFEFRDFVLNNSFDEGHGTLYRYNIKDEYFDLFKKNLNFGDRKIKAVIDCGNGTASIIAKELYSMFPIELVSIYDESDGTFPNHHPDPVVESNMQDLKNKVIECNADIGIAFDGDADRVGFVDKNGNIISSDKYGALIIRNLLPTSKNKKILYDIKCSKIVKDEILKHDGIPVEDRTGASYMMTRVIEDDILFGVEYSGHIYFNNGFPPITSGLFAGLKLIEILSKTDKDADGLFDGITEYYSTPELKFPFSDTKKYEVIEKIRNYSLNKGYELLEIDGVKIYFDDSWALVRCSNTGPNVTARFEATTKERLSELQKEFISLINEFKEE